MPKAGDVVRSVKDVPAGWMFISSGNRDGMIRIKTVSRGGSDANYVKIDCNRIYVDSSTLSGDHITLLAYLPEALHHALSQIQKEITDAL